MTSYRRSTRLVAMPDSFAALQSSYREAGYAILPAALNSTIAADAVARIEAIQAETGRHPPALAAKLVLERDLPAQKRGGIPAEATGDAIFIIGDPVAFDPGLMPLLLHPLALQIVRHLLGHDDIRHHLSNVTMKRPGIGSGISWHRDYPNRYICPARSSFLRVMFCLDGMSAEGGATSFIPGSHHLSDEAARGAHAATEAGTQTGTTIECPPGSLVFIHPKVLHGGAPNHTPLHRRNLIVQWGRADDPVTPPADGSESLCGLSPDEIATLYTDKKKGAA